MANDELSEENKKPRRFRNLCGKQIAKFRNKAGLTQEELAAKMQIAGHDYDRATLAKIENQMRSLYDWEVSLFAQVLDYPITDMYPPTREIQENIDALKRGSKIK